MHRVADILPHHTVLDLRRPTWQNCKPAPRRARMQGSYIFEPLNSRCVSYKEGYGPLHNDAESCRPEGLESKSCPHHTVEHHPLIKSQLASRNQLEGLVWRKFGHVPRGIPGGRNPCTPPSGEEPHHYQHMCSRKQGARRNEAGLRPLGSRVLSFRFRV